MQRLSSLFIGGLALSFVLSGPALAQEADTASTIDPAAEPPRCVRLVNINGYSVIDDEHLLLNGGASRHYLVTMRRSCSSLRFGTAVATSFARTDRVCQPIVDFVVDADGFRCPIKQVEEVDSLDAARELIAARAELEADDENSE